MHKTLFKVFDCNNHKLQKSFYTKQEAQEYIKNKDLYFSEFLIKEKTTKIKNKFNNIY